MLCPGMGGGCALSRHESGGVLCPGMRAEVCSVPVWKGRL